MHAYLQRLNASFLHAISNIPILLNFKFDLYSNKKSEYGLFKTYKFKIKTYKHMVRYVMSMF